jgi:hypothetical protein
VCTSAIRDLLHPIVESAHELAVVVGVAGREIELTVWADRACRAGGNAQLAFEAGIVDDWFTDAIGQSFWHPPKKERPPLIIPLRPDNQPGRIGQQSSCFTLHMHRSTPCGNPTLRKIKVPANVKRDLLKELRQLNINQFTIYNDLDRLSKDIKYVWNLK